jgi:hypothetical protein
LYILITLFKYLHKYSRKVIVGSETIEKSPTSEIKIASAEEASLRGFDTGDTQIKEGGGGGSVFENKQIVIYVQEKAN